MQGVDITINMILDTWCKANMQFRMLAGSELSGIEKSQATHKASAVKLDYFRWKMKVGWDNRERKGCKVCYDCESVSVGFEIEENLEARLGTVPVGVEEKEWLVEDKRDLHPILGWKIGLCVCVWESEWMPKRESLGMLR